MIWKKCSKEMQSKHELLNNFTSTIKMKPVELLKAIRQQALN